MQRVKRATAVAVLPADPVGGTPGYFALPNPGGGIPATVPGHEWYNNIQEELCAVIAAAGIALDGSNRAQLLAALRSAGVFQTPAQFDNTTKVATTAFAQAIGMKFSSYTPFNAGLTLTPSSAGSMQDFFGASPATVVLPLSTAVPAGNVIGFINVGTAVLTVARQGAETIFPNGGSVTSIAVNPGDNILLVSSGGGSWVAFSGSALLGYASSFLNSLAAAGYQKLPGGLVLQWGSLTSSGTPGLGSPVTFPVAFTSACYSITTAGANGGNGNTASWIDSATITGFNIHCILASTPVNYIAVGK